MSDLQRLIEAVESGTATMPMATACYPRDEKGHMTTNTCGWHDANVMGAYYGSLDAAKALHDALLPGWRYLELLQRGNRHTCHISTGFEFDGISSVSNAPARAWLLAILKAYQVQQNAT